ncbi:MAG: beta strand repeat-containing protein [Candidatus Spyradenecus sp.]
MRGIVSTLAVSAAALLLALPGRAVDAPTPDLSFSFTNSTAEANGALSWVWNNDSAVYVDSLRTESDGTPSKAVTISDACHPGRAYTWPGEFSVMSYIKVTDAPDKGTVASFGNNCFLLKQNATTMRFGTAGTYVDATAADLSTGWHLVVAKRTSSGLSIQIDGGTAVTGSTAITVGNGFQIGTRWEGPNATAVQATNLYIDELAIYNSVLTDGQVAALVEAYPAAVPPTYTADLSSSSATEINYSALPWDVGSAPGANARVIIKTPAAGITITMDQATSALSLVTVQGSGKLTFAVGPGVTGTALSTNELVVETDVDVSAITSSLGSVTVAADKTLTTGANTTMTGVPTGSATSKIKVVGSDLTAIPNNVLAMTGIVEIEPTITLSGDDAKLSFNTAQTLTYSANVNAPRLVVGDSGSANATITQLGGTISLSSTATACDSTTASAILLGHWNTTTTYNLQAGTLSAPGGALCLGWDGTTTLNVGAATGNAALVDVYALKSGDRYNTASVTINPTGTLQVGEGGIGLGSHSAKSVTLAGGTLLATATASANIAHANGLNVTAPSTVAAAPSTTLTINKVSGASNLTLGTAGQTGSVVISDVSAYTGTATATTGTLDLHGATFGETLPTFAVASGAALILPAGTEGAITVPDGATLTLVLSSAQLFTGYTTTVTSGTVTFKKVASDGTLAEITAKDGTIKDGTFTSSLNTWTATTAEDDGSYTWSNVANWSKGALPAAGDTVKISVTAEGTTLTLGSAVTVANVSIAGEGSLALAGEALTVSGTAMVSADTTAAKDKLLAGTIQIDDGKTLTVSTTATFANVDTFGSDNALALPALTGTGTLVKEGTGDLGLFNRSAEPTIQVKAGTLHVRSNPTTAMKLAVEDGATVNFTAWYTSFNNSLNSFALKGGSAFILSNGLNDNTPQTIAGAMTIADATDEKPVKIYGSAFGPVTLNMPISGTGTVEFAEGGSFPGASVFACDKPVTVSGVISDGIKVKVSDKPNAVIFSGANTYTGGTDIASGSTLKATNSSALGTGAVTGAGTVAYTAKPSDTGATFTGTDEGAAWTGTVSLSGSWNQTPFSRLGNAQSTLEFNGLTGWCNAGEHTFKTVRLSGNGLTINNGLSDAVTTFTATLEGDGPITMSKPQGAPTYTLRFAGDCSAYAGAVTVATTSGNKHSVCFGASVARKDGTIQVGSDARVQIANGKTWTAISGTEVSGTIGGTGTVSGTLTFNSGAALDATAGALTAGTVSIADGVTVAVTLPEDAEADDIVLTCSSPADVAAKLTGAPDGLKFAANEAGTAVVLATAIVIPPVAEVELSEASQALLLAKAQTAGLSEVTAVTGSTTVEGRPTTLTAAQIDNALAVFGDSVVTADGTNKTLKVDYNFGIVAITPSYDSTGAVTMFTVTVAVKTSDGNAATLAEGATIELVDNDTKATLRAAAPFNANGSGGYDGYFYATSTDDYDSPIGRSFKVKATK